MTDRAAAKAIVSLDSAVRFAAIVIAVMLIREFQQEVIEPNSDGLPVRLLVGPLAATILWNLTIVGLSINRWITGSLGSAQHLNVVGALSAARLLWLLPLANDIWYQHRNQLMVLVALSVACSALTIAQSWRPTDRSVS